MPKAFSLDLRQRILHDVLAGMNYADAGRKYSVSPEFVRRFHRRYEQTQEVAPRPPLARVVPFHQRYEQQIRDAVQQKPGLTLQQLRKQLGVPVSIGTLWNAMRKLKITFKKNARCYRTTKTRRCRPTKRVQLLLLLRHRPRSLRFPR